MSAPELGAHRGRATLRALIDRARATRTPVLVPGCSDALAARLVEQAGFDAAYMTGFGTSATLLGQPDLGLLGLAEMADNAARIAGAISIPVIADADTGYGNAVNVVRTVHEYERAGVAGLHVEDQVMPKRCGHFDDKSVIDAEEMNGKIRAAVDARTDDDLVVIARTDARAPLGFDEARRRAHGFVEAGADVLFVEALRSLDEIETIAAEFADVPLLFNDVPGGRTPPVAPADIAALGFAVRLLPVHLLFAATAAMQRLLGELRDAGEVDPAIEFDEFTRLIGLPEVESMAKRFGERQSPPDR
jgi:2-methylisocitrate lyase-like PEP mutase family enzyme